MKPELHLLWWNMDMRAAGMVSLFVSGIGFNQKTSLGFFAHL